MRERYVEFIPGFCLTTLFSSRTPTYMTLTYIPRPIPPSPW